MEAIRNINKVFVETLLGWDGIYLAQDRDRWIAFVKTVMNIRFS
jgi:hypothetical protein